MAEPKEGDRCWTVRPNRKEDGTWNFAVRQYELVRHPRLPFLVWKAGERLPGEWEKVEDAHAAGVAARWSVPEGVSVFADLLVWSTALILPADEEAAWRLGGEVYFLLWSKTREVAKRVRYALGIGKHVEEEVVQWTGNDRRLGVVSGKQLGRLDADFEKVQVEELPVKPGKEVTVTR